MQQKPMHIKLTKQYQILNDMKTYFDKMLYRKMSYSQYNTFSVIDSNDKDRIHFTNILNHMKQTSNYDPVNLNLSAKISRAIGCLLGLSIADAIGASTQFIPFDKHRKDLIVNGFNDIKKRIEQKILDKRAGKIGIWTDDCSMALAMADSLLLKNFIFDPIHIRYMFTMWLQHGLGNGGRPYSIGLGGNISISMQQFMDKQTQYAELGDAFNNGNGSLMRLAPIPIVYKDNEQEAMKYSQLSSRTTHNGEQAKQCCRLLSKILVRLINRPNDQNWKDTINNACQQFTTKVKSVQYLAASKQQTQQMYNESCKKYDKKFIKFNASLADRNWNWKDKDYTYSPCRNKQQPDYIGSYCMDALSMALHMVWHRQNFKDIVIWSANMGGDCDTVGAIAGQIAGAIYGVDQKMLELYHEMVDCETKRYEVFIKAYKLAMRKKLDDQ